MLVVDLGTMPYENVWQLQLKINEAVRSNEMEDVLLLVVHPPVLTIGRNGKDNNLLINENEAKRMGIGIHRVDRGGDITYHGPGQLVGYPIMDLKRRNKDLLSYLRSMESSIINLLLLYGIKGEVKSGLPGVWVDNDKICAVGVGARAWVTKHGFALNINVDLAHFSWIIPCGLKDKGVTSMTKLLNRHISFNGVKASYLHTFSEAFKVKPVPISMEALQTKLERAGLLIKAK
ncbi:MAG: lipoyl(octanoyl) transferase LipB [Clostridia bacterium]|jgi:lipoate-protein ligase B|nr:lipoyl(octanoyl) transferase LipB [Clostridia bacterium]